ncbi:hypothetical protein ScPMuIL_011714, partial [Solemya velum]
DVTQCRPVVQNVTGNRNIFAGPGATQNITVTGENKTCILIDDEKNEYRSGGDPQIMPRLGILCFFHQTNGCDYKLSAFFTYSYSFYLSVFQ